jgi:hypothetical protein
MTYIAKGWPWPGSLWQISPTDTGKFHFYTYEDDSLQVFSSMHPVRAGSILLYLTSIDCETLPSRRGWWHKFLSNEGIVYQMPHVVRVYFKEIRA